MSKPQCHKTMGSYAVPFPITELTLSSVLADKLSRFGEGWQIRVRPSLLVGDTGKVREGRIHVMIP